VKHNKRGSGLATVLMVTAIATTLAFTTVGLSFHHLSATTRMGNGYYAKNLAEAALAKAIDKIMTDQDYGRTVTADTTIRINFPDAPAGSYGLLTFDSAEAQNYNNSQPGARLPGCFNNLLSDTPRLAPEANVPGHAVFLSAVGVCKGSTRRIDTVVYVPKFPWALAASGSIRSTGDIFLASVRKGGDPNVDADLLPASLATNSAIGDKAVEFAGANITIKGDLQSHSGAKLGNAVVLGEKRLNAATITLPSLNIADYDTKNKNGVSNLADIQTSAPVKGFAHRSGDLLCADSLVLDGAVLYVDGNLNVSGGIKGTGAVIVKGKTTVAGTSSFVGDNKLALLSEGDVAITGTSDNPSHFNGLLYSEGNLSASHTSLVGTVIANDKSGGSGGQISLDKSKIIQDSSSSSFNMTVTTSSSANSNDPAPAGKLSLLALPTRVDWSHDTNLTAAENQQNFINSPAGTAVASIAQGGLASNRWNVSGAQDTQYTLPAPVGSYFSGLQPGEKVSLPIGMALRADMNPSRFWDAASQSYVMPFDTSLPTAGTLNNPDGTALPPGKYVTKTTGPGVADFKYVPYTGSVAALADTDVQVKVSSNPEVAGTDGTWKTQLKTEYLARLNALLVSRRGTPMNGIETGMATSILNNQIAADFRQMAQIGSVAIAKVNDSRLSPTQTITFEDATNPNYVPPSGGSSSESWSLDLNDNRLIPFAERVRVLYWRETFGAAFPSIEQGRQAIA
jgi:hypothetical protein